MILLSTTSNWLFVFIPTGIMLVSMPLWYVRKLPNVLFSLTAVLSVFAFAGLLLVSSGTSDEITSPGWIGGIFIAIVILIANGFQLMMYIRLLNNNRCPQCHCLRLRTVGKDIEKYVTTNTTVYRNSETGKKYVKENSNTKTYTTYTNYCPECDSLFAWTDESEDWSSKDTRPQELR